MNQDTVKEILMAIEETGLEFSVTFTGKNSKKVNGLYKPDTHEIILHNKNFSGDNELLYTAIHEYTHHRICEDDGGVHSSRVHTQRFWSTFHRLLQKAEEKGFYRIMPEDALELLELTETIRTTIMTEDGKLMKELGRLLGEARVLCKTAGVRYEDYIDRVLCIPRNSAAAIEKMHVRDVKPDLGYEAMKIVANIANPDKRQAAEALFLHNHSPASVREHIKTQRNEEDPRRKLEKEKQRLERTIACLQDKLSQVEDSLARMPITSFVLCCCLFLRVLMPAAADSTADTPITVPAIPDIPRIEIGDGIGIPVQPPRIVPPVMHPIVPKTKKTDKVQAGKEEAAPKTASDSTSSADKQPLPLNGLNARVIASLARNTGNMFLFDELLSGSGAVPQRQNEAALTQFLMQFEQLRQKHENTALTQDTQRSAEVSPQSGQPAAEAKKTSGTGSTAPAVRSAASVQDAAELVRLRINNRDIKRDITDFFCSSAMGNGNFLYGADRQFTANGRELNETVYFFGNKNEDGVYDITIVLRQDPINTKSFLYKLSTLSPISVRQTSDLLFWHYKDSSMDVELIFRLHEKQ